MVAADKLNSGGMVGLSFVRSERRRSGVETGALRKHSSRRYSIRDPVRYCGKKLCLVYLQWHGMG